MPCFVITNDRAQSEVVLLNRPVFRVGRRAKYCDHVLDHPAISRLHLIVRIDGSATFVSDNHSRNGTFINGERLSGERELVDGDVISICGIMLEFRAEVPADRLAGVSHRDN